MNPLQLRLAALRRRLRLVITFRGVSAILGFLLLAALATGFLDWRLPGHLPSLVRAASLVGSLALAGCVAYQYLLRPLLAKADDLSLALRVETHYPAFNDALASAVQFLEQPADSERGGSPGLRRQAVERALGLAQRVDFHAVVDARGTRAAGLSLATTAGLALFVTLTQPQLAWTAFFRLAHPFGGYSWPAQTLLEIQAPARVARGEVFEIQGQLRGVIPERARVAFRFENAATFEQDYEIQRVAGAAEGSLTARLEAARVQRSFRFQVRTNDAVSPWQAVAVLPPPQLVPLAGRPSPQIYLRFPDYTDLPAMELPDGTSSIEAAAGTHIRLRAAADRPLARAWLEYPSDLEPGLTLATLLTPCGLDRSWLKAAKQIAARLEAGGTVLTLDFIARVSGTFTLHLEDELGLRNKRLVELRTLPDPAPLVELQRPSRSRDSLDILPQAEITLQVQVEDPRYAVRSVFLRARHRRKGSAATLDSETRLPLYEHAALGEALPRLLAGLLASPLLPPLSSPLILSCPPREMNEQGAWRSLRLRPTRLEIGRRWSLGGLRLSEGDTLILQACADDFDDVTVGKKPGCSQELELRVVSRTALDLALDEAQAQIQQELVRLHKQQQEALAKVIPAEAHARNHQGPLQPKHLDELLQAEQLQQQIRARVGNHEEGLRAEAGRVLQALRDNHLPRAGIHDRMEAVSAELERLAREELSQIEPQLTEARKQQETGSPSAADQESRPLAEARKHQEEVRKTLSELLKLLEPWSSTREVKGEAKAILQEQRKLAEETAALSQEVPLSAERARLKPAQKVELERAEEAQRNLAERAGQLLQKLKRVAKDRANRDPEMAKQLGEAANRGDEADVVGQMEEAERGIHKLQLANAGEQQQGAVKAMDQVVKALEDRHEEELERLIKKIKEAEQQLAELSDQQERLRAKSKEAGQLADASKREEALKQLAREQEQLQRAVQEMVRELSRLRADRASQALRQAGSGMQRAGRQMDQGDAAEEQQDEVLDRLNDAQRKLQQAQEDAEEELAREKLAKVADQIKGLRERQEALLTESGRIHRELLQQKDWARTLQASLRALTEAQRGLGDETERIGKDKFADAKVFAHLLNKSAAAMRQACDRMSQRLDKAQDRLDRALNGDDAKLDVAAEQDADTQTQRLQGTALRRLDQLLQAVKPDGGKAQRPPAPQGEGQPEGGGRPTGGGGPNGGAGEQLPPLAQLKALRALQQDINERTTTFAKEHPDRAKLTRQDDDELQGIRQEQVEISDLFNQLSTPPETQGEKP